MPVGRGDGVKSVGVRGGKNRETVTASLCLLFTALLHKRQHLIGVRDNRVHRSIAER